MSSLINNDDNISLNEIESYGRLWLIRAVSRELTFSMLKIRSNCNNESK